MKVYIVTEGTYSAYHICAVFTNKESAEEYIKWHFEEEYDHPHIEEYETDSEKINDKYFECSFEYGLDNKFNIIINRNKIKKIDNVYYDNTFTIIIAENECAYYYTNHNAFIKEANFIFDKDNGTKITVPYLLKIKRYFSIQKIPTAELATSQMNKIAQDIVAEIKNYIFVEGMKFEDVKSLIFKNKSDGIT